LDTSAIVGLIDFFENIDALLLIVVRCAGFFVMLPIFSGDTIPTRTKLIMALFMAYLIFTTGRVADAVYDPTTLGYFYLLVIEFLVGFILAFAVYLVFMAFFVAGQIIDYQIGFAMVNVLDPITQIQVPVTGNLIYLFTLLALVQTGNINTIIKAFAESYEILPIGSAFIISNETLLNIGITAIVNFFSLGIKISMPILGTILILDVALGVLVKAVPQMNIFVVGMPIKLLIGLMVFFIIVPAFSYTYGVVFNESYKNIQNFMEAMKP